MQAPLCEPESEKTISENELMINKTLYTNIHSNLAVIGENLELDFEELEELDDQFAIKSREVLMKMFMLACKSDKEKRAYEIACLMSDTVSLQLAVKYATKTRALVLAQHLNLLMDRRAAAENEKNQFEEEQSAASYKFTASNNFNSNKESGDCIIEDAQSNSHSFHTSVMETQEGTNDLVNSSTMSKTGDAGLFCSPASVSQCITPTVSTFSSTRLNPFKMNNGSAGSCVHKTTPMPLHDSSKSIIREIEDKMNKQASATKEKDSWKPTPTRKLVKPKAPSSNTPMSSFFSNKNAQN